jgi:hypothetical protein
MNASITSFIVGSVAASPTAGAGVGFVADGSAREPTTRAYSRRDSGESYRPR